MTQGKAMKPFRVEPGGTTFQVCGPNTFTIDCVATRRHADWLADTLNMAYRLGYRDGYLTGGADDAAESSPDRRCRRHRLRDNHSVADDAAESRVSEQDVQGQLCSHDSSKDGD